EEQATKTPPLSLPESLRRALACFVVGGSHLFLTDSGSPPISMLVHSTARNDVQERYEFLIRRQLRDWQGRVVSGDDLPIEMQDELTLLFTQGLARVDLRTLRHTVGNFLHETSLWLVNSATALNKVDWT